MQEETPVSLFRMQHFIELALMSGLRLQLQNPSGMSVDSKRSSLKCWWNLDYGSMLQFAGLTAYSLRKVGVKNFET